MGVALSPAEELEQLKAERDALELPYFNEEVAWRIGCHIREAAVAAGHAIAIEVSRTGGRLFFASMPGASPDNESWIRRKRNVVERFGESSLTMAVAASLRGKTLIERFELPPADFVHSGGSVVVRVTNCGPVGAVSVSGLDQREDHRLAAAAIAAVKATL